VLRRTPPDGHTLLIASSAYVVNPGLYAKIPYDPYTDFARSQLGTSPKRDSGRSEARREFRFPT